MFLSTLKIWNFRKFGANGSLDLAQPHFTLNFKNGITLLIGENDSGKTAIIDAIKLVIKTHGTDWMRVEEEDFFRHSATQIANRFRIECRFDDLSDDEGRHFTEWLAWDDTANPAKAYLKVFVDVSRNNEKVLPFDVRGGIDEEGTILTADAKEKLKATYLRPLRDAENELSSRRNSRLSQILHSHDAFKDKENHLFIDLAKKLNGEITSYFKGQNREGAELGADKQGGKLLKKVIDGYLSQFAGKETLFEITDSTLKSILESLNLLFLDGYNLGLGSHNLLSIASELLHLQKQDWDGLRLGLVEEIEAHLHPQVQLQVIETLQKDATNVQLIFTTHSPNIGSKIPLDHLIICQEDKAFPMGEGETKLTKTDYGYLQRFLDVTKANLFFAKGVILVEGWAEELLLPVLARKIGINLTSKCISVINIGNTAFLRYAGIFKRVAGAEMKTKVAVITDSDIKPVAAGETKQVDDPANPGGPQISVPFTDVEVQQRIAGAITAKETKYNGQVVKAFISPHWTLEYCVAKSQKLRQLFYKSVLEALKEQKQDEGVTNLAPYDQAIANVGIYFNNWTENDDSIAFTIYDHVLNGKTTLAIAKDKISKAIIAQRFAANLEADTTIAALDTEGSITYLLNAIKHAAGI
jgi:putative ATP-dependent endonuclease of the OLD family